MNFYLIKVMNTPNSLDLNKLFLDKVRRTQEQLEQIIHPRVGTLSLVIACLRSDNKHTYQNGNALEYHIRELIKQLTDINVDNVNKYFNLDILSENIYREHKDSVSEDTASDITTDKIESMQVKNTENWSDDIPESIYNVSQETNTKESLEDSSSYCVANEEHNIYLEDGSFLETISNKFFNIRINNLDDLTNVKFYMESRSREPYLIVYKYGNNSDEYFIGDDNFLYKVNNSILEKCIKYDNVKFNPPRKFNNKFRSNENRNVNKNKSRPAYKKCADFIMRDYFVFRNLDDDDEYNNIDEFKDTKFCFIKDRYGNINVPFLLYHALLVGDDNKLYDVDSNKNITSNHDGQKQWREVTTTNSTSDTSSK
jgi:hypothetical protein